jgi:hypothetical protein
MVRIGVVRVVRLGSGENGLVGSTGRGRVERTPAADTDPGDANDTTAAAVAALPTGAYHRHLHMVLHRVVGRQAPVGRRTAGPVTYLTYASHNDLPRHETRSQPRIVFHAPCTFSL